jgi:hypothetical protein
MRGLFIEAGHLSDAHHLMRFFSPERHPVADH